MNKAPKQALGLLLAIAVIGGGAYLFWLKKDQRVQPVVLRAAARHDLVMRDGRWYKLPETNSFTGLMVDTYTNGTLMARSMISNGLPEGWSETWYTNGQMQMRENFSNGISDGLRVKWYPGGRKMSEAFIVDGKITGIFQSWHENGQVSERIQMKQGKPDGIAWAFYPSGFAKAEVAEQDGKELNRKTWKDGEYKTTQ